MKKNRIYIVTLTLFLLATSFIVLKYKKDEQKNTAGIYLLQPRSRASAQTGEWKSVQKRFDNLIKAVRTNPDDVKSRIAVATLFIKEARITGNYMYYDAGAMKYVNEVLEKDADNFEALTLKALLYLSQHHFADGLVEAQKAQKINPYNAFVYGILIDANVEMGNYDKAVVYADSMVSMRPDIRSYSRISYLREIYGDYKGAIEAMKMAVDAGVPGDEGTEWARVQLGHLYENTGDIPNASMHYNIALQNRPSYAYAIAGMGRLSLAAGDYNKAIGFFMQADSLVKDQSFKEDMIDVYMLMDEKNKADAISNQVIDAMNKDAQAGQKNENIGHYADKELAYAYIKTGSYDKALEHALAEYNRRPANNDVNETVAWVYYKQGKYNKALPYLKAALKTNSKNPTLLCRAGLIYAKTDDAMKAKVCLQEGLKNNPNISESLKSESMMLLKTL